MREGKGERWRERGLMVQGWNASVVMEAVARVSQVVVLGFRDWSL